VHNRDRSAVRQLAGQDSHPRLWQEIQAIVRQGEVGFVLVELEYRQLLGFDELAELEWPVLGYARLIAVYAELQEEIAVEFSFEIVHSDPAHDLALTRGAFHLRFSTKD
jgi:hypothetical protein